MCVRAHASVYTRNQSIKIGDVSVYTREVVYDTSDRVEMGLFKLQDTWFSTFIFSTVYAIRGTQDVFSRTKHRKFGSDLSVRGKSSHV